MYTLINLELCMKYKPPSLEGLLKVEMRVEHYASNRSKMPFDPLECG